MINTNRFSLYRSLLIKCASLLAGFFILITPVNAAESLLDSANPWKGNFGEMLEKRSLRALVVYNPLMYFLDGATQRGVVHDGLVEFEKHINQKYKLKTRKFHVVFIPVARDQLLPALEKGLGDIAVANLTITPERLARVDFSVPAITKIDEVLVTGPAAPAVSKLEDLAGLEVFARKSSSYYESLLKANESFESEGLKPIQISAIDENLEDSDLLDMVNAGLLPMVFVDSHKAEFWETVFSDITVHRDIAIRTGGEIGWAMRKNSPELLEVVNEFVDANKKGTLLGNTLLKRYFKENEWTRKALNDAEQKKFNQLADLFREYADQYDFDHLMLMALGYQESGLDQSVTSTAGAVGIMQIKPSTAADKNVAIENIDTPENNIHAGTKYLRFIRNQYFDDPAIDDLNATLLTFASYNAGPNRIRKLRESTTEMGLDPNVWFGNVEHAVAKEVGQETVQYVSHIFKYYIAYRLLNERRENRDESREKTREAVSS